jgi:hypothetical protein
MKIYSYKELREKNTDGLLDLLSKYLNIRIDLQQIDDISKNKKFVDCEMNIRKIENELMVRAKND